MEFHRLTFGDAVMEDAPDAAAQAAAAAQATADAAAAAPAAKDADEKLGEGGIKALKAEREAREAAEKRAAEAEAKIQAAENAKLSDIDRANKERDDKAAENATLKATNARLAALAEHPVPKEYQDLVTGTDEASYLASAKKISDLYARAEGKAPKNDPVPGSGKRGSGDAAAKGSIRELRQQIADRKNK
jgi:colicin import membrane protein